MIYKILCKLGIHKSKTEHFEINDIIVNSVKYCTRCNKTIKENGFW